MNKQRRFGTQAGPHPQPVPRQPLDQHGDLFGLAIQQQRVAMGEDEEIGQPFALRQSAGPPRRAWPGADTFDVVGDEALKEGDTVIALDRYDRLVRVTGSVEPFGIVNADAVQQQALRADCTKLTPTAPALTYSPAAVAVSPAGSG